MEVTHTFVTTCGLYRNGRMVVDVHSKRLKNVVHDNSHILDNNTVLGLSQLCWHNFSIIGTSLGGFSIKSNARIIGRILAQLGGGACHLVYPPRLISL